MRHPFPRLSMAAAIGFSLLVSCAPGSTNLADDAESRVEVLRPLQLTEEAVFPERDGALVSVEVYDDRLVFLYDGPPAAVMEADDVVSGVRGGGYLRRLVTVTQPSTDRVEATTAPAELGELIGDGHFIVHLNPRDGSFRVPGTDIGGTAASLGAGFSIFGEDARRGISCGAGASADVTFDPQMDMDLDVDVEVDLRWGYGRFYIPRGELHYVRFELSGTLSPGLTIRTSGSAEISCEWSPPLPDREWPTTFPVGPVPVVITHTIAPEFTLTISGTAEVAATMSADATLSVRAGADFIPGRGWRRIWTPSRTGNSMLTVSDPGTVTVTAEARAGIGYTGKIYDTAGPGLSLQPFFSASFEAQPVECQWTTEAKAGLDLQGSITLDVPLFDYNLAGYEVTGTLAEGVVGETSGALPGCDEPSMPDGGVPIDDAGPGSDGGTSVDPGMDRCATAGSDCLSCNDTAGCGFCRATGTCVSDSRQAECGDAAAWADGPSECQPCDRYTQCGGGFGTGCLDDAFCGWCASTGTCLTAESGGGSPVACSDWRTGTSANACM